MDLNEPISTEKLSKINAAGLINLTIENLWKDCYNAMAKGDLITWNRKLDALWLVLGGDVKEGTKEETNFNKIDLQLHTTGSLNHKKVGFQKISDEDSGKIAVQYLVLRNKSLFLRRLQNSQGKGTAYDDGSSDYMD